MIPLNVISIGTKSLYSEDKKFGEVISALVYDPQDGKLDELPLEMCYLKTLQDDKDKTAQPVTFSAPGIPTKTGRENR